jgi:RND family efflux transporter MFP subunit
VLATTKRGPESRSADWAGGGGGRWLLVSILLYAGAATLAAGEFPGVTSAPVGERLFFPRHSAPAEVASLNQASIPAEVEGRLLELSARVGDRVAAGQPLARLDCRDHELRLRQAQAGLEAAAAAQRLAERQLVRVKSLRADQAASEELLNQRQTELAASQAEQAMQEAQVAAARLAVSRCQVQAPFTGVVVARLAAEGEWLPPGAPLLRLLDSERLELVAQLPLALVATLEGAAELRFETAGHSHPARLRRLLPLLDPKGRHQEGRFDLGDPAPLPGSSGRLVWHSSLPHLPADLLVRRDEALGVFLLEGEHARFHPIPTALEGQPAPSDLPAEARLILEGRHGLVDGQRVARMGAPIQ